MDGTKDTRHGIEDTDPHMGMLEREKDAEHRTQGTHRECMYARVLKQGRC